jgi:hypothetical protein
MTMIRLLVLITALAACATPAQRARIALDDAFWLTLPSGWTSVNGDVSVGALLVVVEERSRATCHVLRRSRWGSSLTQAEVNQHFAEGELPDLLAEGAARLRFDTGLIDGIHVITNAASAADGARYIERRFMVADAGHISLYSVQCRSSHSVPDDIAASMDDFVLSLGFVR